MFVRVWRMWGKRTGDSALVWLTWSVSSKQISVRTSTISRHSLYVDIALFPALYLDSSVVISSSSSSLLDWLLSNGSFARLCEMLLCLIALFPDLCLLIGSLKLSTSLSELSCCLALSGIFLSFLWLPDGWSLSVCLSVWGSTLFLWELHRCHLAECSKWRKQVWTGVNGSRISKLRKHIKFIYIIIYKNCCFFLIFSPYFLHL